MDLQITRTEKDDEVVLACVGRLDAESGDELARVVAEELRRGYHAIRLDLSGAAFLSSAGIRGLFEIQRGVKAAGGTCLIREASSVVRRVLDLTRLTPILLESPEVRHAPGASVAAPPDDLTVGPVTLARCVNAAATSLRATLWGSPDAAISGDATPSPSRSLSRHEFALGLGALADGEPPAERAGELVAACGSVFHRPPHPHAAVDFVVPTGDLRAEVTWLAGLSWEGLPTGHAGFEPAGEDATVRLDDLLAAVLTRVNGETVAVVVAGEIHGLVGAELIRPLSRARGSDTLRGGTRDIAGGWLTFSREPVHARHTALIVGVVSRGERSALSPFVRAVPGRDFASHFHAVVFPYRPLRRSGVDLSAAVSDLAASRPLTVMHLIADPSPVLGSGRSELIRGAVWYSPLTLLDAGVQA